MLKFLAKRLRDTILLFVFSSLQLSFSPSTPMNSHVRVLCLLVSLLLDCCGLAVVCGLLGAPHGMHTLSFMAAEVRVWSHNCMKMKNCYVNKGIFIIQSTETHIIPASHFLFRCVYLWFNSKCLYLIECWINQ